jgi:hypothetical protein
MPGNLQAQISEIAANTLKLLHPDNLAKNESAVAERFAQ